MFFKLEPEENVMYLKPIFSDFEKEYLLSEIDMIIKNGGDRFVFDNFEKNRISVYMTCGFCCYIGFCSGLLSDVLWTLLATRLIVDEIDYGSYLNFATEGSSYDPGTGQITLNLNPEKIRQFFLEEELLKLITVEPVERSDSIMFFIKSVNNNLN